MELVPLKVDSREETGKGPAARLRAAGSIPGVVYGMGRETVHLSVSRAEFERVYSGSDANVLIELDVPGQESESAVAAMVKALQRDPVTKAPLAIDFQWVSLTQQIEVDIPIEVVGNAPGVDDDGGVVQVQLHNVSVSCLPTAIPEHIEANIDGMTIGDALFIADLPQIEGVSYTSESDEAVLTIAPPISEEQLETHIEEEALEALVDVEVGEEIVEAEELTPEEPGEEEEASGESGE
ncbi:MAG: 50S ribosomal protein L25 [candidate division WS1 bacterium]|jgi:large subunit ribosomal protein L25|nr:50S ribosomal protein L25 [candidate division WS1 bacterium]